MWLIVPVSSWLHAFSKVEWGTGMVQGQTKRWATQSGDEGLVRAGGCMKHARSGCWPPYGRKTEALEGQQGRYVPSMYVTK